jgi:transcriptional regulator with XRE-family HTH domain
MDAIDLIDLRSSLNISQITMASRIGLSLRVFRNIENGKVPLRRVHELAIERVLIGYAIDRNDPELLGELQSSLTNMIMSEFSIRTGAGVSTPPDYRAERFSSRGGAADNRPTNEQARGLSREDLV